MQVKSRTLAAVAVAAIVVASGCLTVTVDSTVNNDGTISEYQLTMEMPDQFYSQLQTSAQENDQTLAESIEGNYSQEYYGSVDVETDELPDQETARITITLQNFDPNEFEGADFSGGSSGQSTPAPSEASSDPQINVTVEEDRIVYVDDSFNSPTNETDEGAGGDFGAGFSLEYSVTMPGQIIESETNADEIDGRTATWSENGTDVFSNTEIRAVSERGSGGGGGLGLPGFGAGLAVVALLLVAGAMAARARRD